MEDLIGKMGNLTDKRKSSKNFSKRKKHGYIIVRDILLKKWDWLEKREDYFLNKIKKVVS